MGGRSKRVSLLFLRRTLAFQHLSGLNLSATTCHLKLAGRCLSISRDFSNGEAALAIRNNLVSIGNAARDGKNGWFVGHFAPHDFGLIRQESVEIKWAHHPKGDRRPSFGQWPKATTIAILVSGHFITRVRLPDGLHEILLRDPGDYIAFGPGVDHSWEAVEESLVITVRFPSIDRERDTPT